jgi:hypothetical protein
MQRSCIVRVSDLLTAVVRMRAVAVATLKGYCGTAAVALVPAPCRNKVLLQRQ